MRIFLLLTIVTVAGCTSDRVIVDERNLDRERYERDLSECRVYKEQVPVVEEMVKGAAVGAVVGGAAGAAVGNSETAKASAGAGAVYGAADRMVATSEEKARVVKNCMRARGYQILN